MSGNFRARRPASPPPGVSYIPTMSSQRFPHPREEHLDADEKRAAASKGFAPGKTRNYPPGGINLTSGEWKLLIVIVLVACAVRLFRLSKPNSVVFDEVHFGKFASRYIKTRYFVDVHPPLAKLLITFAAFVFGYDGDFDFKDIGKIYEHVPYVAMRMVPATLGVATVPLAYLTLRALDCRATTALLASMFITFENGMVTQSRHILLDSPLIFFTALTVFLWCGFCNEDKHEPFTQSWWTWLLLSGLSLGAVVSCKWVGLFTIATVGVSTIYQLWNLLGDLRVSPRLFMRHFMARALCLIAVPIIFYMFMFQLHFLILENSGEGDGFMSSEFQHTLGGRGMEDTFADVAVGSTISIRHVNTQGGYLHSHPHNYPGGSKQQQITLYPHRDDNNNWMIANASVDGDPSWKWENAPLQYILPSMRNEVSAYGMPGFVGDANDDWFVEIEKGDRGKRDSESWKRLRTLRTHFRLRHALTGCYLFSHKVKLPEWGYEQQEVTCNKNAVKANSMWYVETSWHPNMPADAPKVNYKLPGFVAKFWELQRVMWTTNAGLTDRHTYDSRPDSWPLLRRGINFWVKDHRQIYLIGNPMVWYLSTVSVFVYLAVRGILILRAKRGFRDFDNTKVVKYDTLCGFLFTGWVLHYFPFFLMGRQLFLHHYFPALYFGILLSCGIFDLLTSTLRPRVRLQIAAVLMVLAIWNFQHLSPLAYGSPWTKAKCESAKWLKTWDFSCNDFYDSVRPTPHLSFPNPTRTYFFFVVLKIRNTRSNALHQLIARISTIGGAADGRPAVAVHPNAPDNAAAANNNNENGHAVVVNKETDTMVAEHIAEPGRDIFAGDVGGKGIKSDSIIAQQREKEEAKEEEEEKEISSVGAAAAAMTEAAGKPQVQAQGVGEKEDVKAESTSSMTESESATSASASASASAEDKEEKADETAAAPAAEAGPLGEAEVEAEKAAAELFPDAA
ncbi:Dolichyl-phosphate-mannose-protein mannosyltransferase-domain-containing protein [Gymnopilus junonius]|uniref:Dolichyl-phosphate-mannose--protein mannosyltransferase n=1 Tax=Gymnopilus junonius TaxID=109634 RepID=A0A9P5TR03_GYMJU|nr:Dolichyl-phosphate-mannose-protein mannosyltransferase-domain-containing protein [Gymnopilus junonius]